MVKKHGFKFSWKVSTFSEYRKFKNNWFGKVRNFQSVQRWWFENDIREIFPRISSKMTSLARKHHLTMFKSSPGYVFTWD